MSKRALITGVTGMDGAYLSQILLRQGYEVFGGARRNAQMNTTRLKYLGIDKQVQLVPFEMLEYENMRRVIEKVKPDEIYSLAAQSFVGASFEQPVYTFDVTAGGVVRLLEAVRAVKPDTKLYHSSSSEMFGKVQQVPQNEETKFYPRSPYAVAKTAGHQMCVNFRESYGMFIVNGLLFNHEQILRGLEFVPRKITSTVANISCGLATELVLGNLDARRDWGDARDYCQAMYLMMQYPTAEDWVIATGETHTVREFVELAFEHIGIYLRWVGSEENEQGLSDDGHCFVRVSSAFYRPCEVELLVGDSSKARHLLGWKPEHSPTFNDLVHSMMESDLARARKEQLS